MQVFFRSFRQPDIAFQIAFSALFEVRIDLVTMHIFSVLKLKTGKNCCGVLTRIRNCFYFVCEKQIKGKRMKRNL